jgi:hypothetical protein
MNGAEFMRQVDDFGYIPKRYHRILVDEFDAAVAERTP